MLAFSNFVPPRVLLALDFYRNGHKIKLYSGCGWVSEAMKALGVFESKRDPIRKKLVRRLLEEQDKVLRSYFAQKGETRSKGGDRGNCKSREQVRWDIYACRRHARTF
jgi:hypothetical protein